MSDYATSYELDKKTGVGNITVECDTHPTVMPGDKLKVNADGTVSVSPDGELIVVGVEHTTNNPMISVFQPPTQNPMTIMGSATFEFSADFVTETRQWCDKALRKAKVLDYDTVSVEEKHKLQRTCRTCKHGLLKALESSAHFCLNNKLEYAKK